MPSLGADMAAGTLVEWKVKPGTSVKRGDIIAEVATDKGDIEIEVFEDGVVETVSVEPGQEVPVGTVLAMIRGEGEAAASAAPAAPPPITPPVVAPAAPSEILEAPAAPAARVPASPAARRLALERGVDLAGLTGTGPGGAITRDDVERAVAAAAPPTPPAAVPTPREARVGMRRAIAAAMARSNREIPHYYLATRIDMGPALAWLEAENQRRSVTDRLLVAVLLVKAVAKALGDVPELNGFWIDGEHRMSEAVHVGFAIALRQDGLTAPAIRNVHRLSLDELRVAMSDLITRARAGRLRGSELSDATITVTSLGDLGVETVYGVIYPPQVALVSFGTILRLPWADGGMIGVRPVLVATLSGDHRATDGRRGAQFLQALSGWLADPAKL